MRAISAALVLIAIMWATATNNHAVAATSAGDPRDGYAEPTFRTQTLRILPVDGNRELPPYRKHARRGQLGLPPLDPPLNEPLAALGHRLFFDRRLSFNDTLSCAMCHVPEQGFTQHELRTPVGIEGRSVKRNSPGLLNVGFRSVLFHDGREHSLILQIWSPLLARNEMGNPAIGYVLRKLTRTDDYGDRFAEMFEDGITARNLGLALTEYQRSLVAAASPFDQWHYGGDRSALSQDAVRGFERFKAFGCNGCHSIGDSHALFTDEQFHDTGTGYHAAMVAPALPESITVAPGVTIPLDTSFEMPVDNDLGRYEATGNVDDRWRFLTPTLRNVALTAPYMHDGSLPTLGSVIDFYRNGGVPHEGIDPRIRPLEINSEDEAALIAFLESLTGANVDLLADAARRVPIGSR